MLNKTLILDSIYREQYLELTMIFLNFSKLSKYYESVSLILVISNCNDHDHFKKGHHLKDKK